MRVLIMLASAIAMSGAAQAQETRLTHQSEIGWTSNAEKSATGRSDLYLEHNTIARFARPGDQFALRGSFEIGGTRYRRLEDESDWYAGVDLTGEAALSDTSLLRLETALRYDHEGQVVSNGPQTLGLATPSLRGRIGADHVALWDTGSATLGVGYSHKAYGDTAFSDATLAPRKTRADIGVWTGRVQLEQVIGAGVAVTGLARFEHGVIADGEAFGRLEASVLRLGLGLQTRAGPRVNFALGGGVDIALARGGVLDPIVLPYGEAEMDLGLTDALVLRGSLSTRTDMIDPADGYLDHAVSGRLGLAYALTAGAEIEIAGLAGETRSVGFDTGIERTIGVQLGLTIAASETINLRARASRNHVLGLAPGYIEDRIGLLISASL